MTTTSTGFFRPLLTEGEKESSPRTSTQQAALAADHLIGSRSSRDCANNWWWVAGLTRRRAAPVALGSLLMSYYEDGEIHHAARAGTGPTNATQRAWQALLKPASRCPFVASPLFPQDKIVNRCEPTEIAEMEVAEWARDGQPVVLGWRRDKVPQGIILET
jgi:hypothetical protein